MKSRRDKRPDCFRNRSNGRADGRDIFALLGDCAASLFARRLDPIREAKTNVELALSEKKQSLFKPLFSPTSTFPWSWLQNGALNHTLLYL